MINCGIDGLQVAIESELADYSQEVAEEIKTKAKKVANQCKNDIQAASPVKTGKYKKGWKVKKEFEDNACVRYRVKNTTSPFLTHLLEFGHQNRDGGRTEGKLHISPAEKKAVTEFETDIKKIVKGG